MSSLLLADIILVLHAAFIVFVVGGQVLILAGLALKWRWVRNFKFRLIHLMSIGFVVINTLLGELCPLTIWEGNLRRAAGEEFYGGGFIAHHVQSLIYYEAPPWLFALAYTAFGALVLATWFWGGPKRNKHENSL